MSESGADDGAGVALPPGYAVANFWATAGREGLSASMARKSVLPKALALHLGSSAGSSAR
jgi:hypothetical protein